MSRKLWILLALMSVSVVTAQAQAAGGAALRCKAPTLTPDVNARYDELDTAAHPDRFVDMRDAVSASYINRELTVAPGDTKLLAARGYSNAQAHLRQAAERDFRAALATHPNDEHLHLSYGWALFEMGDDACAITQWQKAAAIQGGHPSWLPHALAESYWRMGRHALALQWYDVAAHSQPERWGSVASIRAVTAGRNYSDAQREMLETIYTQWQKQSSRTDIASR